MDLIKGVSIDGRSLEEMKLISQEELFVSTLKTKVHDVGHNEDLLSYFEYTPDKICVGFGEGNDNVICGEYTSQRRHSCIKLGVMDKWYAMNRDNRTFVIQSMDGVGSTWTISSHCGCFGYTSQDRTGGFPVCLYKWHKGGNITSLLPPKYGWEDAKNIEIKYSIR